MLWMCCGFGFRPEVRTCQARQGAEKRVLPLWGIVGPRAERESGKNGTEIVKLGVTSAASAPFVFSLIVSPNKLDSGIED